MNQSSQFDENFVFCKYTPGNASKWFQGYVIRNCKMDKSQIISYARELRKKQTPAETLLWANLRNRKLQGRKFLRQHPILYSKSFNVSFFFIADFYCAESQMVIELDGKIHDFQKEYDMNRETILNELGLTVLRFKNENVLEDIGKVLEQISMFVR